MKVGWLDPCCQTESDQNPRPKTDRLDFGHRLSKLRVTIIKMLDPDYYKVLLEIGVGRRFWQCNPSAENAHAFYRRVVRPLRQLQRRGVVEKLQEITPADDRTPIAVEIIGQVNLTKEANS